ncbi:queuosine precursor transporter [uncultured Fusobacterium sp.]|uniref:queuosine precursor transporter n=1 Tax=uncultured Fusobacterium sp. TaxID=159267 RepID=UPI0025F98892|nr:queuosine precursor transporter [uncultured Fusobacterium sp.]MCF2640214.1 queuosine precursor transporter [Fusobacterium varium]
MRNEILWAGMLIVNFLAILFAYVRFGRIGLYIWIPISTILANIQVVMLVDLFGFGTTLGNILYAGGFLVTDILAENYGREYAKRAVKIGFFSLIVMTVIMQIAVNFTPSDVEEGILTFNGVKRIFDFMPRIVIASLISYWVSQTHDIWAYEKWRERFSERKHIWIRNNMSTMVSQLIDNSLFTIIAFWGIYPKEVLLEIFITTYFMKFIVAVFDTPFVYIASYLKSKKKIKEIEI